MRSGQHKAAIIFLVAALIMVRVQVNTLASALGSLISFRPYLETEDFVRRFAWNPAANKIAAIHVGNGNIGGDDDEVRIYDADTLQQLATVPTLLTDDTGLYSLVLENIDWSSDGNFLAISKVNTVSRHPIIEVWNVATTPFRRIIHYEDDQEVSDAIVAWRPNHNQVAFNSGMFIKVLDIDTENIITIQDEQKVITSLLWRPDGEQIASGRSDIVRIYDGNSKALITSIPQVSFVEPMDWSPDGTKLAIPFENSIHIWNMQTQPPQLVISLEGSIAFTNNLDWEGETIVSENSTLSGTTIHRWNSLTGELVETININGIFSTFVLSPDATRIVYSVEGFPPQSVNLQPLGTGCIPSQTISSGDVTGFINAINTANSNPDADVIGLETGTYTFTTTYIPLNALPAITSDITICSIEGATLTRQADAPLFGFFEVSAGGSLTLENLTLNGGDVGNDTGGALVNEGGTVTLNNVTFSNNHANTGGAIDSESGSLTLTDSTFENNQADYGGAIDNDTGGTLSISGSTFTSNTAALDGGAIHNDGGTLTVTDSTFTSNTASRYGGALDNTGSATISGSTFSGNSASWSGGAIRNTNTLTVNNGSVLENNAATLGENNEGWGGGVYNTSSGTATISSSTLSENAAIQGGGIRNHGDLTLNENTQLTGNSASSRGGGIYNAGGTIQLSDSALLNNTAAGDGGALYVTSTGSQVTISGSTLSGNTAGASGGAIRSSQGMTITDSVFSNNTATSNYGSLYLTSSSTTTAHNSCFSNNTATSVGHTGTTMQDFTGNWWGAADGPSGSGPGSGDAVNNRINFASFLTAGCPHP